MGAPSLVRRRPVEEQAMPDFERWKDRVEFTLDGRQIFFLFFGTAVAACLIFVAGVFVGRRIEQRAAPPAAAAGDPLAALDQLDEEPDDGLTFHDTLLRDEHRPPHKNRAPAPTEPRAPEPARPRLEAPAGGAGAIDRLPAHAPAPPVPEALRLPSPAAPHEPAAASSGTVPEKRAEGAPRPRGEARPDASRPRTALPAGHFTLQLSSFADESDADAFARRIRAAGYEPQVVRSEVPGKGVFYRVRVGDFASKQLAEQARLDYEHKQHAVPLVVPR